MESFTITVVENAFFAVAHPLRFVFFTLGIVKSTLNVCAMTTVKQFSAVSFVSTSKATKKLISNRGPFVGYKFQSSQIKYSVAIFVICAADASNLLSIFILLFSFSISIFHLKTSLLFYSIIKIVAQYQINVLLL